MRMASLRIATALTALCASVPARAESAWSPSAIPGEETRSIVSCSPASNDHSWVCLALRCESANEIALYAELTNLTLDNRFDLVFGATRIAVEGRANDPETPYSNRIDGPMEAILAAMRSNAAVTIDRPAEPINPTMATIPLDGSEAAIAAITASCTGDAAAVADDAAPAWTLRKDDRWCSISRPGATGDATSATFATPRGSELVYLRLTYPTGSFVDDADIVLSADLPGGMSEFTAKATGDAIADLDHAVPGEILSRFAAANLVNIAATPPGASVSVRMAGLAAALADLSACAAAPRK